MSPSRRRRPTWRAGTGSTPRARSTRAAQAADAVEVDTSDLGLDEVIAVIVKMAADGGTRGPAWEARSQEPQGEERT